MLFQIRLKAIFKKVMGYKVGMGWRCKVLEKMQRSSQSSKCFFESMILDVCFSLLVMFNPLVSCIPEYVEELTAIFSGAVEMTQSKVWNTVFSYLINVLILACVYDLFAKKFIQDICLRIKGV